MSWGIASWFRNFPKLILELQIELLICDFNHTTLFTNFRSDCPNMLTSFVEAPTYTLVAGARLTACDTHIGSSQSHP
jgi:hypothetical protein